jgi:hypothetical protein
VVKSFGSVLLRIERRTAIGREVIREEDSSIGETTEGHLIIAKDNIQEETTTTTEDTGIEDTMIEEATEEGITNKIGINTMIEGTMEIEEVEAEEEITLKETEDSEETDEVIGQTEDLLLPMN